MTTLLDEKKQTLESIVPEYESKNPLIQWIFTKRLTWAVKQCKNHNEAILDAGCGDGRVVRMLSNAGFTNITGIDFNENVTTLSVDNARFLCEDLTKTTFEDNVFDTIIILDVLEHFEFLEAPLSELRRILKPGGKLIVSMPTENIIYKIGRFLLKGTFSMVEGPGTGIHYHGASGLSKQIEKHFTRKSRCFHPFFPPFDLFHLSSFKNTK
ncbi:MAG: hypothetical protein HHAS10_02400 [Candidatus Altimarinota bacterium]